MKTLIGVLIILIITFKLDAQTNISDEANILDCISQYASILKNLHQIQNSTASTENKIKQTHLLLCSSPGSYFPFPQLYNTSDKQNCKNKFLRNKYHITTDCVNPDFERPIVEYFVSYYILNKRKAPIINNICIINNNENVTLVRYNSVNEIIESDCQNKLLTRIAVVVNEGKDYYISELRAANKQEIQSECLNTSSKEIISEKTNWEDNDARKTLFTVQNELNKSIQIINKLSSKLDSTKTLISNLKTRSDSLSRTLQQTSIQNKKLLSEKHIADSLLIVEEVNHQNTYDFYVKYIDISARQLEKQLNELDIRVSDLGTQFLDRINEYEKFNYYSTKFLGFNYGLIQAPYNQQLDIHNAIDPIKKSFHTEDISRNFGISVYSKIGFHFSNIRINHNTTPTNIYTAFEIDHLKEDLFKQGILFEDMEYNHSSHNLNSFNLGLNVYLNSIIDIFEPQNNPQLEIPILNSMYLNIGLSVIKGQVWDYYSGSFPSQIQRDAESDLYVLGNKAISTTGPVFGVTYLKPYFQIELGYNELYSDFYLNIGANIPLTSKKARAIGNDDPKPHENPETQELRHAIEYTRVFLKTLRDKAKEYKN